MNIPLVSVVMSVYNSEQYLAEAIESILNQTVSDFEFIIINDGSTDSSLSIIESYMEQDVRIVLISRVNKGLPYSLNEGISSAKGKYIARMDADDISLPERLNAQLQLMENNPDIGICGTWAEVFGDYSGVIKHPTTHSAMKAKLLFNVCFVHPSVMFRTSLIKSNDITYDLKYSNSQDYKLWSEVVNLTTMANIPHQLIKYRVSKNSITSVINKDKSELRFKLSKDIYDSFLGELDLKLSEKEYRLHFSIGVKERIQAQNIKLSDLNLYLDKISNANKSIFDKTHLRDLLGYKFLAVVFFKAKQDYTLIVKCLPYKYFYLGLYAIIKKSLCGKG